VDDLKEIGNLEQYISTSQCMLILLTKGYFESTNCLRELRHSIEKKKPLVLVHESDEGKGGQPLDSFVAGCTAKGIDSGYLFGGQWPIVAWHRVADFQLLSLRLITEAAVGAMPIYAGPAAPHLFSPSEITRQKLHLRSPVVLYVSGSNPGAASMADELESVLDRMSGSHDLRISHQRPANFAPMPESATESVEDPVGQDALALQRTLSRSMVSLRRMVSRSFKATTKKVTHFLLYLNQETFLAAQGARLAHEVREARATGLPIVLVHENDTRCGGCIFGRFFQTTPQDLIDDGIYRMLAVPCYEGAHREVSLVLVAKSLGAQERWKMKELVNVATSPSKWRGSISVWMPSARHVELRRKTVEHQTVQVELSSETASSTLATASATPLDATPPVADVLDVDIQSSMHETATGAFWKRPGA